MMNKLMISVLLMSLAGLQAGCSTTNSKDISGAGKVGQDAAEVAPKPAKAAEPAIAAPVEPSSVSRSAVSSTAPVDPFNDPNGILGKRSVYYPFDVSVVQAEDKAIVEAHAKYLSEHGDKKVRLEGNCDERGSDEYNLALGQRRADGVKKLLLVGGVKDGQVSTVSYGEEKPKATGHDEASWSQNRRTDLNYNAN